MSIRSSPSLLSRPFSDLLPDLAAVRRKFQSRGLWVPQLPRPYSELGLSCVEYAMAGELLGQSPLGHFVVNAQAPDAGNMELLREFGSDAQRERWLVPLVQRRRPELLRHDRARPCRLEPGVDEHPRRTRLAATM